MDYKLTWKPRIFIAQKVLVWDVNKEFWIVWYILTQNRCITFLYSTSRFGFKGYLNKAKFSPRIATFTDIDGAKGQLQ